MTPISVCRTMSTGSTAFRSSRAFVGWPRLANRFLSPSPQVRALSTAYTASSALFDALAENGVEACFVNLGSDHPSIIEAAVQRQKERKLSSPRLYTCPNEYVALSAADGYARVTGRPQAVIVHTDVGTQSLSCGLNNASVGHSPVLIFAGMCPLTEDGSIRGSRTEYMHWLQEPPIDQKAIVPQYTRYAAEVRSSSTIKQMIARAFQFAQSDPKGPVYLCSPREILEKEVVESPIEPNQLVAIRPSTLPEEGAIEIATALVNAENPLIITGYSGRDTRCPEELLRLANAIPGLRVLDTAGSDMCFPYDHRGYVGMRYGGDDTVKEADVIFALDCPVPWIPARNRPQANAKIYHVSTDPLNSITPISFFPATARWKADTHTALMQINTHIKSSPLSQTLTAPKYQERWQSLGEQHANRISHYAKLAAPNADQTFNANHLGSVVRSTLPKDTVFVIEAVTNAMTLSDQLQPTIPGSWLNCGGTGGAAIGVKLGLLSDKKPNFVCQIVGDGTYLATVPSSVYWIAARYGIPFLTIVLNNGGWNAPRNSLQLVHPDGLGAASTNEDIHISFRPTPDYAGIARAGAGKQFGEQPGEIFTSTVSTAGELKEALEQALRAVEDGRSAVLEACLSDGL